MKFLVFVLMVALPSWVSAQPMLKSSPVTRGRLAFTYFSAKERHIWIVDFSNSSIHKLISTNGTDEHPVWSPDGRRIAFSSTSKGGVKQIFIADAFGNNITQISDATGASQEPDWSPDGTKIVFATQFEKGINLVITDTTGKNPTILTTSSFKNVSPRWSPRGDEIAYTTDSAWPGWDLVLYNIGDRRSKVLTTGRQSYSRPEWDPTGSKLIFAYGDGAQFDIWMMAKGSMSPRALTADKGREFDPVWIDDETIFYVAERSPGTNVFNIYWMNTKTKETAQVTTGSGAARYLSYTPLPAPPALPGPK